MSNIQLVFDPIKIVRTITKTKNGCTTTETQTEYLVPYDCKAGDRIILFLKDKAKTENGRGVIVGDVITRSYSNNQYTYFVQYLDSTLATGVLANTLSQCDILKVCCYGCEAEYFDLTSLSALDAGDGVTINEAGELSIDISDDGQNLMTTLPDGVFVPEAAVVVDYNSGGEDTALPITATITITNPSNYLPMRVTGSIKFWGRFTTVASATGRSITRDLSVDAVSAFGAEVIGTIPSATGSVMSSSFNWVESLNVLPDADTLLDPGQSKTYEVEFDGTMVGGDTIDAVNCSVNVLGINYSPL